MPAATHCDEQFMLAGKLDGSANVTCVRTFDYDRRSPIESSH